MRVLVACEFSGVVRDAFRARGHDAVSCDLVPSEVPGPHVQGDVRGLLAGGWDLLVAFPPCTDLSTVSARHWPAKQADGRQRAALVLVHALMTAPIPRIAVENPTGRISSAIRPPDQIVHPWQFGHPWHKRTALWLENLPPLTPTAVIVPVGHWVDGGSLTRNPDRVFSDAERYGSHHRLERQASRSRTFQGIADAMAEQWGSDQGDGALFPAAPFRVLDRKSQHW